MVKSMDQSVFITEERYIGNGSAQETGGPKYDQSVILVEDTIDQIKDKEHIGKPQSGTELKNKEDSEPRHKKVKLNGNAPSVSGVEKVNGVFENTTHTNNTLKILNSKVEKKHQDSALQAKQLKVSPTKIIKKQDLINSPSKKKQAINYYRSITTQEDATDEDDDMSEDEENTSDENFDGSHGAVGSNVDKMEKFDPSIPQDIIDEMQDLLNNFPGLQSKYQLIDKIGEGTFSSVYKARDKSNRLDLNKKILQNHFWTSSISMTTSKKPKAYVALKRIYVTSSPQRIYNELKLLYTLSKSPRIAPLYDAIRYQDQIIAVLPYYSHEDFRIFYRILPIKGIKKYMYELFEALAYIHERGVIHRDIKPTNFLYNTKLGKGVLVDFGLAELEDDGNHALHEGSIDKCPCINYKLDSNATDNDIKNTNASNAFSLGGTSGVANGVDLTRGYPKHETRRSRRANRAGTRGFRAPEVLLKCPRQSVKIDMWSCGVILLCFLARRFPMFQSLDDVESLMELSVIFGIKQLNKCCKLHGLGCNISTNQLHGITEDGFKNGLKGYVKKLLQDENEKGTFASYSPALETLKYLQGTLLEEETPDEHGDDDTEDSSTGDAALKEYKRTVYEDHKHCFDVLQKCMAWNYHKRSSAKELLKHKWFDELRNQKDYF